MNKDLQAWNDLEAQVVSCRRCPRLVAWREEVAVTKRRAYMDEDYWGKPVPGLGDRHARLLIIGLAPGAHGANRTGRMFTGDGSGDFLFAALHRAGFANQPISRHRGDGLELKDVFISAVCRCAPPANKPTIAEIKNCRPFLETEVGLLSNLTGIVVLGRIAFDHTLRMFREAGNEIPRLDFFHGAIYELGAGLPWLLVSYHPSRQNTQTGLLTEDMFDAIWSSAKERLDHSKGPE